MVFLMPVCLFAVLLFNGYCNLEHWTNNHITIKTRWLLRFNGYQKCSKYNVYLRWYFAGVKFVLFIRHGFLQCFLYFNAQIFLYVSCTPKINTTLRVYVHVFIHFLWSNAKIVLDDLKNCLRWFCFIYGFPPFSYQHIHNFYKKKKNI